MRIKICILVYINYLMSLECLYKLFTLQVARSCFFKQVTTYQGHTKTRSMFGT